MNCHRPYCFQSAEKPDEIIRADTRDTWRFISATGLAAICVRRNGEMRYYYADGRISNLKLPQVFVDWGNPADFTFSFSSLPMRGAGFYRIGDPSEQTGSFSTNFQQKAPINPGYINGLNAYGVANGAKTNLRENGAVNKAAILLVNTDKFYVTLQ